MSKGPTERSLSEALAAAGSAHHDYEANFLGGQRDAQWPGWYSAYVLGRLGDFTSPTLLTEWLNDVPGEGDWPALAAAHVLSKLGAR